MEGEDERDREKERKKGDRDAHKERQKDDRKTDGGREENRKQHRERGPGRGRWHSSAASPTTTSLGDGVLLAPPELPRPTHIQEMLLGIGSAQR